MTTKTKTIKIQLTPFQKLMHYWPDRFADVVTKHGPKRFGAILDRALNYEGKTPERHNEQARKQVQTMYRIASYALEMVHEQYPNPKHGDKGHFCLDSEPRETMKEAKK